MEVKKEFENFLSVHFPEASLGDMDEIVLSYIADVLGELGRCTEEDTSFDAEQFCEMISAYVPEFTSIERLTEQQVDLTLGNSLGKLMSKLQYHDHAKDDYGKDKQESNQSSIQKAKWSVVWEWVFELVDKQRQKNEGRVDITEDTITQHSEPKPRVADTRVEAEKKMRRGENVSRENVSNSVPGTDVTSEEDKDIVFLKEMFPDLMDETLRSIHRQCRGDMDKTIQKLLQLSEQEKVAGKQQAVTILPKVQHHQKGEVSADRDLKEATLARYAFVDTDEDKVTHRPVLAKPEPKKMVRYRDGQVVSTKGERYTVMTRKDTEGDDMKNTYINLKPLRKYRFH